MFQCKEGNKRKLVFALVVCALAVAPLQQREAQAAATVGFMVTMAAVSGAALVIYHALKD